MFCAAKLHPEIAEKVTLNEVKGLKMRAKMLHFVPWPARPGQAA